MMICSVCMCTMRYKKEIGSRAGFKITCRSPVCMDINRKRYKAHLKHLYEDDG